MPLPPMNMPAEIRRIVPLPGGGEAVTVAKGPLVIMAYGLMAIDSAERGDFHICSSAGDFSAEQAEEALRTWEGRRGRGLAGHRYRPNRHMVGPKKLS